VSQDSTLLVVGLYVYDDLLDHAARSFEGYDLFNGLADPGNKLLWECIRDTYLHTGAKPTTTMLAPQCDAHLVSIDPISKNRAISQIFETMRAISKSVDLGIVLLAREHVQALLQAAVRRAAVDRLLAVNTLKDNSSEALIEHVGGVSAVLQNVIPKRTVRKRPLAAETRSDLLRATKRWKWGIDYWDTAGLRWYKKEIHGLLGPTGGGKTVNMTTIATRQLKYGRKVLVALYEQALEEDVEQRILSNLSGVSMNELRDRNEKDIPKKVMDRIDAACAKYVNNLVVFDMVGENAGTGGVAELKAQIDEEKRLTGFEPDLIIIDWLGEMVMRYAHLGNTDAAYRRCCEKFMSDLVQFKEDTGYAILVLHQSNTQAQALRPTSKPNKTMAHEFRSFANKCDSCSVLGTMDRTLRICYFIPDKSRRSNSEDRIIKLDGEFMRFYDVTLKYRNVNNAFVPTASRAADDAQADENRAEIRRDY